MRLNLKHDRVRDDARYAVVVVSETKRTIWSVYGDRREARRVAGKLRTMLRDVTVEVEAW